MHRRTFLLGTAAWASACSPERHRPTSLGTLVYIDEETLWLRDLPDGPPHAIATGHRIANPRFSPAGGWISFREGADGEVGRLASTDGKVRKQWQADAWLPGREQLVVHLLSGLKVFKPADDWSRPQSTIAGGDLTIDETRTHYAWTSSVPDGHYSDGVPKTRTSLLLSSFEHSGEPRPLDETIGFFEIAGFTRSGDWLLYWMSPEMSASIEADGLNLCAVSTRGGPPRKLGVVTLVHPDFVSFSPTRDVIAVTAGLGRETWTDKFIALIDLGSGTPEITYITEPSVSSQLPAWSPDGGKLAWSVGQAPTRSERRRGAPGQAEEQSIRSRRIWVSEIGPDRRASQLTNDPAYFDEEPLWSQDGSHILFCRMDAHDARTIWLMRNDGSEVHQVAGPLRPPPGALGMRKPSYLGYYGYANWRSLFDCQRGRQSNAL